MTIRVLGIFSVLVCWLSACATTKPIEKPQTEPAYAVLNAERGEYQVYRVYTGAPLYVGVGYQGVNRFTKKGLIRFAQRKGEVVLLNPPFWPKMKDSSITLEIPRGTTEFIESICARTLAARKAVRPEKQISACVTEIFGGAYYDFGKGINSHCFRMNDTGVVVCKIQKADLPAVLALAD